MAPPKGKVGGTKVIFIKKKGKGHAHHGGAWKVAYADFVTAMMALFMVLWLVSQTDESTRSSLSRYFRTGAFSGSGHVIGDGLPTSDGPSPGGGTPRMAEGEILREAAEEIERIAGGDLASSDHDATLDNRVRTTVTDDGLLVQITDGGDGMVFGLSSSELTPSLRQFLADIAPVLGRLDNQLQIHGHTDARPFPEGSPFDNWDLSFARADSARELLEAAGVRSGQVVGVLAHGPSAPLEGLDPFSPENRRLAILAVRHGHEREIAHGVVGSETRSVRETDAEIERAAGSAAPAAEEPVPVPPPEAVPSVEEPAPT